MAEDAPEAKSTSGSAPRRKADERRERIIAAARTLFAQGGFHSTGIAQIARESGVLVGQIYRDFAGKEDLIAAIVERDLSDLLDDSALSQAIQLSDIGLLDEWLVRFIARRHDEETRSVVADIISESTRNPRIAAILAQAQQRLRTRLTAAAAVWLPGPDREGQRRSIAEFVLTITGAMLHRQMCGLDSGHDALVARLAGLVEQEIERERRGPS